MSSKVQWENQHNKKNGTNHWRAEDTLRWLQIHERRMWVQTKMWQNLLDDRINLHVTSKEIHHEIAKKEICENSTLCVVVVCASFSHHSSLKCDEAGSFELHLENGQENFPVSRSYIFSRARQARRRLTRRSISRRRCLYGGGNIVRKSEIF